MKSVLISVVGLANWALAGASCALALATGAFAGAVAAEAPAGGARVGVPTSRDPSVRSLTGDDDRNNSDDGLGVGNSARARSVRVASRALGFTWVFLNSSSSLWVAINGDEGGNWYSMV